MIIGPQASVGMALELLLQERVRQRRVGRKAIGDREKYLAVGVVRADTNGTISIGCRIRERIFQHQKCLSLKEYLTHATAGKANSDIGFSYHFLVEADEILRTDPNLAFGFTRCTHVPEPIAHIDRGLDAFVPAVG